MTAQSPKDPTSAPPRETFRIGRSLYLIALGFCFLAAFVSLRIQVHGLFGEEGLSPVAASLDRLDQRSGGKARANLPTVFWYGASDAALARACEAGALLSVMLMLRWIPVVVLPILFYLYLSFLNVGGLFLGYQWDTLLIEAGFLGIFLAPWTLRARPGGGPGDGPGPSRIVLFLHRFLLFKLMFSAGVVKLGSMDDVWWDLTALEYHYWSQPLPTPLAWYAHQLPGWLHQVSCFVMFIIEIVFPFLFFGPRRVRLVGAAGTVGLMIMITLTGNYNFFNFLTVALALLLVDDTSWPAPLRRWGASKGGPSVEFPLPVTAGLALAWLPLAIDSTMVSVLMRNRSSHPTVDAARKGWMRVRAPMLPWVDLASSYHISNSYGLFASMTRQREELEIEGSLDGRTWVTYRFRYKPSDPRTAPRFCVPHQPRLDWQMWFAALGPARNEAILSRLFTAILEGHRAVIELIGHDPFGGRPPRFLRCRVFDYRFTSWSEGRETGAWWTRTHVRDLTPILRLPEETRSGLPDPGPRRF